jgi:hypothetical protein
MVLCGLETWSVTLRDERRLKVFENRVLRRIFGLKRDEMIGGWRKLHDEGLHNLYSCPSIIGIMKSRRMIWVGYVACMGAKRNEYRILVGKPKRKRPPGRPSHRWIILKWILGWGGMDWSDVAQDRYQWKVLMNMKMNLRVP